MPRTMKRKPSRGAGPRLRHSGDPKGHGVPQAIHWPRRTSQRLCGSRLRVREVKPMEHPGVRKHIDPHRHSRRRILRSACRRLELIALSWHRFGHRARRHTYIVHSWAATRSLPRAITLARARGNTRPDGASETQSQA